jgi:N6-adenosine-specific RNA methylase IME4
MTFAPLPMTDEGFACVACDAGIHFNTWSAKGQGRAPSRHYRDHSPKTLMALPLSEVLARDAWMFLWWPEPHLPDMTEVMGALGFEYSGRAFTWIKLLSSLARNSRLVSTDEIELVVPMGCGKTTRKNSESCWLGRRGKPKILRHDVRDRRILSAR